jgi:hypothetical protein
MIDFADVISYREETDLWQQSIKIIHFCARVDTSTSECGVRRVGEVEGERLGAEHWIEQFFSLVSRIVVRQTIHSNQYLWILSCIRCS